jgi:hypothetical protein
LKETDKLEDLGFDGCMPLTWILKTKVEDILWIHLAHNVDEWLFVANVMDLRVPYHPGEFLD